MEEFAAGAATGAGASLRIVLRSIPVLRLISCCETLFCSSVTTVLLCCGVKTFTPRALLNGGAIMSCRRHCGYRRLRHRLTGYWGILKWPSLGEFGWPPGDSAAQA